MKSSALNQKELLTGLLYVLFGAAGVIIAQDYGFGSTTEMGAGFFPIILGSILCGIGAITLIRAFITASDGEPGPLQSIYWKGVVLVIGAVALFAWLLPIVGLVIALPLLVILSAMASTRFQLNVLSVALLAMFCALCIAVFVLGLGVPMPLFGSLFG